MADIALSAPLPVGSPGKKSSGWYGMLALIVTEASLFLYLLFSYFYYAIWTGGTFLPPRLPTFELAAPDTIVLLLSSVSVWWGERGARRGGRGQLVAGLVVTLALGAIFIGVQLIEWREKPFHFNQTTYSSLYFTITGFHMMHVAVGMIVLFALLIWSSLGYFDAKRNAPVAIGAIYWHFIDAVWLAVFFTIYVTPYLGTR